MQPYSPEEQLQLLRIARHTLEQITADRVLPHLDHATLPPKLCEDRACFVTLHIDGELRGCTGTLVARRALADEVVITTSQTALHDPRFMPVKADEVPGIHIEISVLTPPQPLSFSNPRDIPRLIRPNIDGVTLLLGTYRGTFLPQVWESIPDPSEFLTRLCQKMGLRGDSWLNPNIRVETYQTLIMEEPEPHRKRA